MAIDNPRLYDEVADTAEALQRSLLPPGLPVAEAVEFGAAYAAAGAGNVVGGDFYDVFPLGRGLGGRGGRRVWERPRGGGGDWARLARSAFRLLAPDGARLPDVLRRLNRLLMEQGEQTRFCTLAAAEVRVTTDGLEVCLVCAGHPPPVLVPARGSARFVGRLGTLIGVTTELDLPETYVRLGRGDLLVFYTDGVLERRSDSGALFGEDRLLRLLATRAGSPAEAVADAIEAEVRRFARAPLRDDLAVLVIGAR